jgi:hypothetical protein
VAAPRVVGCHLRFVTAVAADLASDPTVQPPSVRKHIFLCYSTGSTGLRWRCNFCAAPLSSLDGSFYNLFYILHNWMGRRRYSSIRVAGQQIGVQSGYIRRIQNSFLPKLRIQSRYQSGRLTILNLALYFCRYAVMLQSMSTVGHQLCSSQGNQYDTVLTSQCV